MSRNQRLARDATSGISGNAGGNTATELTKERNRLAADRTLMAWIRTSLSLIAFGFGIGKVYDLGAFGASRADPRDRASLRLQRRGHGADRSVGLSIWPTRRRSSGTASFSNHGLSLTQRRVCQLGCGSTKYSGRKSRQRSTVSVIDGCPERGR